MQENDASAPASNSRRRVRFGPGFLVTAAFIGPGTVVTASKAGAQQGCGLLWVIVFACFGTIVLQSLAARLGILERTGLGEAIRDRFSSSRWLQASIVLIISAIGVGNTAYQTGNLTGAAKGIASCIPLNNSVWILLISAIACGVILAGKYRWIQSGLIAMVILLSVAFLTAAAMSMPSPDRIVRGLLIPTLDYGNLSLMIALIGTTIVPYNLFLHASSAAATWSDDSSDHTAIAHSDIDTILSVSLGGLITSAILITASTAFFDTQTEWKSIDDISQQLNPTLGRFSSIAFAVGLFAAGLTSSITAPLATAYATCGCLGWSTDPGNRRFRTISIGVVLIGAIVAIASGKSPSAVIVFAQVANGLLLPVVAIFLLIVSVRANQNLGAPHGRLRVSAAYVVIACVSLLGLWRIASLCI